MISMSALGVVAVGVVVNVCLIGIKFYASFRSGSAALLAEANHSLYDLLADAGTSATLADPF